ncbi:MULTISPECIES: hypothetical protein [unclassified Acidiphilium]|uniref:hypothetical protein n=1 Tax=unclassified Acidiphilium TaxID=2617493 RepID=UPI000BDB0D0A|nr:MULTISPECIES: hypothetical protein [unclassified Acidiphilium]OYV57450.1 MAG: hypothetical protein B7Z76_01360 [Acidiphilium sp. 20-67-58]HQT59684.1 hypothetical protein [Acidiphilium sp.]
MTQIPPYYPLNRNLDEVLTLAAASANATSTTFTNPNYRGVRVGIDVTAISGTSPSLTISIVGVDPVTGSTFTLLQSAAISATGYSTLLVYPGITATANETVDNVLPFNWQITAAIGGASPSVTAKISAVEIL